MEKELIALLDSAVSDGRTYWDSYYGHDNSFHMAEITESAEYKSFLQKLKDLS